MKKGTLIFSKFLSLAVFATLIFSAFTSCREEKAKTETVIIEKPVEQPKTEDKDKDGTSISVDGDGVEFSTKSGNNETEVSIKD